MQANSDQPNLAGCLLQLLLFIDKRPSSREQVQQVRMALKELREECDFELQIVDVSEQPYLAEYFRLIATPALVKLHPEPRQILAGGTLVQQLQHWWSHWQRSVAEYLATTADSGAIEVRSLKQIALEIAALTPQTGISVAAPLGNAPTANLELPISAEVEQVSALRLLKDAFDSSASSNAVTRSTELIQLSDEVFRLKREKEELEHQLEFKDQILTMLAHDLRNPLTATAIALETLERNHSHRNGVESHITPQLTARLLNHARTQTRAIDRMITDILQAARGMGSDARIYPHELDLGTLCLDVLNNLQDRFQEKSHQVEKDIPSDLPMILADGERIRQVLMNLFDNAVKYTPDGGTIQLVALHRTTQKVQISVVDNGLGIPPENQERIFEECFRLKRDEDKAGYGIGLSLCQRIIRAHYGQLWVDSTLNHGSSFHFTLPVFRK
ncbi:histidine kinase [Phormidium sp. CLA17]|uniref:histidine kinase n=1 Tax=Leptolyngbya sp. Cla-17 TaxID=2803751 RepID=UPI0014928926|nr:histidine kinase [Leptolyngbya sp. Cla-17]MBM0743688.1 histidine kinase [Leptolyngbya sp. Cla-17]